MTPGLSRRLARALDVGQATADERQTIVNAADGRAADFESLPREVRDLVLRLEAGPSRQYPAAAGAAVGDESDPLVLAAAGDPHAALLQQQWEQARADLLKAWPTTAQPLVDELADQAEAAAKGGDLSKLGGLEASAGVISALASPLAESGSKLAKQAAAGVVAEAAEAKVTISAPANAGAERVRQTADAVAQIIARGYASGAARTSLQLAGSDPAEVKAEVKRQLGELGQSQGGLVADNVGALLSAAQHAGRLAVLEQHPAQAYVANEHNDDGNRCKPCGEVDQKSYATLRAALADYPSSGFRRCLGGSRCRGHISPQW